MSGRARDALSLVVGAAGLAMMGIGLNWMLNTGSCASGGPYITTRSCPDDTIWWTLLLIGGLLAWLAGITVSREGLNKPGTGQLLWAVGFAGLGAGAILKAALQESIPADARLGAYIIGGTFIPVGLGILFPGLTKPRRQRFAAPDPAPDSAWSRLNRLRSAGVLSRAEFNRLNAAIGEPDTAQRLAVLQQLADDNAAGRLSEDEFTDRKNATLAY